MENFFIFEKVADNYKIHYKGEVPKEVNISVLLTGIEVAVQTIRYNYTTQFEWFIPGLDYTGCSKIEIRDKKTNKLLIEKIINKSLTQKAKGQNIICLGLNKTGTTSFTKALTNLGFKMFYEGTQFQYLIPSVYHGDYFPLLSVLNNPRFNLFNDNPFAYPGILPHIYPNRPDDIYVLTVRKNLDEWIRSVMKNIFDEVKDKQELEDNSIIHTIWSNEYERLMLNQIMATLDFWGIHDKNNLVEKLTNCYERHLEDTIQFFKGKSANFKIVDVSRPNELESFSKWIGIESALKDFPWENKSK